MNSAASFMPISACWERPKGETPYMVAKLMTLACRRISGVTPPMGTPKTDEAVRLWMSMSSWKARIMFLSPDRCAATRSSICE